MFLGVLKRFAFRPPAPESDLLSRFRLFVRKFVRDNFVPLDPSTDLSLETWLSKTHYPEWRKQQLRQAFADLNGRKLHGYKDPAVRVKMFQKAEVYPEYKYPRAINARADAFKCLVGPTFKAIEKVVLKLKYFVKYVPVAERPAFIKERLYKDGAKYFATDFTSFEAQFVKDIMESCEMELYDYMTSKLPTHDEFLSHMQYLLGTNVIDYKWFTVFLESTRMSGEMNTSLGNGFSNLMFMLFMLEEQQCRDVDGVVEGDDGLFRYQGECPKGTDFERLGLKIKLEPCSDITEASFCGLIFDPEDLVNITDPMAEIATMFWVRNGAQLKKSKLMALLRCKALSMAHQYPGSPVMQSMSHCVLRLTRRFAHVAVNIAANNQFLNTWEREQLTEAGFDERNLPRRSVPRATRHLMESKFDLPVATQLRLEQMFDQASCFDDLDFRFIHPWVPKDWLDYSFRYCRIVPEGFSHQAVDHPVGFPPAPKLDREAILKALIE